MSRLSRLVLTGALAGAGILGSPAGAYELPCIQALQQCYAYNCVQEPCYDCVTYPCYPSDYVEYAICSTIGCPPPA